jgi:hypothetical protein
MSLGPATPLVVSTDTATNTAAVVTLAAPSDPNARWLVEGYAISASDAPAAPVAFTITTGAADIERLQVPDAAFAPIVCGTPMYGAKGASVVATLPALGAGVVGTVRLSARIVQAL